MVSWRAHSVAPIQEAVELLRGGFIHPRSSCLIFRACHIRRQVIGTDQ